MSCKRYPVELLQQGPNPKKSRRDRSEPLPPPWWQARGRKDPITNPELCFVCQRNDICDRISSKSQPTEPPNSILRYFGKSVSISPRNGHSIESKGIGGFLPRPVQQCQPPSELLSPCRYCDRGICRGCLVQCPNCQHDFCSLCWGHQGDNSVCVECQWSPQEVPTSVGVLDDVMHVD